MSLISMAEGRWKRWGRCPRWSKRCLRCILSALRTHSSVVYITALFISEKSQYSQVSCAWQKSHGMNLYSSFVTILLLIYFLWYNYCRRDPVLLEEHFKCLCALTLSHSIKIITGAYFTPETYFSSSCKILFMCKLKNHSHNRCGTYSSHSTVINGQSIYS